MSVIFDQLRISDDGKKMYINLHVNKADYFDKLYLDSLTIMTSDKVSEIDCRVPTEDYIYKVTFGDYTKEADLVLEASDFLKRWETEPSAMKFTTAEMPTTLFFVYVKVKGTPGECTPCSLDREVTVGVTFDENILYQRVMDYIRQLAADCTIPVGFTDFILRWNAFNSAICTEHFLPAIEFFNTLFDGSAPGNTFRTTKPCGCHG